MTYDSALSLLETEIAIKYIKDYFELELAKALNLTRVSAPLFVFPETGLNDNLNGFERAVRFDVLDIYEPEDFEPEYIFSSNMRRYAKIQESTEKKCITTSNMKDCKKSDFIPFLTVKDCITGLFRRLLYKCIFPLPIPLSYRTQPRKQPPSICEAQGQRPTDLPLT